MAVISKMSFDNGTTRNLIGSTFYGKCSTAATTAAKTVTIGGWDESVLDNVLGTTVYIYFEYGNSASSPTLSIDGSTAHSIVTEDSSGTTPPVPDPYATTDVFPKGLYALVLTQFGSGTPTTYWLIASKAAKASFAGTADTATNATSATYASSVPWSGVTDKPTIPDTPSKPSSDGHYMLDVSSGTATWSDSPDLNAIESLSGTAGYLKKTAANTWSLDNTSYIPTTSKGAASGVAELDSSGKVPSSQLPSYVDDVLEYATRSLFPTTGTSGIIYIATDTNLTYRWSGSDYVEISPSLALGETSSTAYRGDRGKTAYGHATDSSRLTTAQTSGLYKISTTAEGHVGSVTAVQKSDITGLGIAELDSNNKLPIVQSNYLYGKCTTAAGTADKTVTISGYDETDIASMEGVTIFVLFRNANTASSPTLNVSSAGAHSIVVGNYTDPVGVGKFSDGLHAFTLVKGTDNNYHWWVNEGRDTIPEAPATDGSYQLDIYNSGLSKWTKTNYFSATGGDITGDVTLLKQVASGSPGDSYGLIFQRGTLTDSYNDWMIIDSGGYLYFRERGNGSTAWTNRVTFNTSGNVSASSFSGSGSSLTSLNASNISSGTLGAARLPGVTVNNTTSTVTPGSGGTFTVIDSITVDSYGRVTAIDTATVTLPQSGGGVTVGTLNLTTSWSGNGPYTQTVSITGGTANSKIDLQPNSTVLSQMTTDGTTSIYIENNNGTFTAYAMGAAPTAALSIQYTKTEVS